MRVACTRRIVLSLLAATLGADGAVAAAQRPLAARAVPLDILCAPQAAFAPPARTLRIAAGTDRTKALFAAGDAVIVNAGTAQGLRAGQHFYIRRVVEDRFALRTSEAPPRSIHTPGWLTIVDTLADVSVATVVEACDGVAEGDYLEPLVLPGPPTARPGGEPDYVRPGRIILGPERRQLGAEGSLMVLDRGTDHGLHVGQRLTIFRHTIDGGPVVDIAEAVVTSTSPESAVIRIGRARDVVQAGDLVAIHR
ncbi:MAG TPA: hypothetical protein VM364_04775 [Vicinamibacterales bacterium]|nr:hypothetical protein [Vicinamibacterales bacterium]